MGWPRPLATPLPATTEVLIIGQTAVAYSCALSLVEAGILCTLVADGQPRPTDDAPPVFIGGLVDNITRMHHAYGDEVAQQVWQFSQRAAAQFAAQLRVWQLPCQHMAKLRLHHSAHQQSEGREAQRLLAGFGLGSAIAPQNRWAFASEGVLIHNEDGQGYTFDPEALGLRLAKIIPCLKGHFNTPEQLTANAHGFRATTACGQSIAATMVVIACPVTLLALRPFYRDVFIPYSDQWQLHSLSQGQAPRKGEKAMFYADHGYVYGTHLPDRGQLMLAGGRFVEKGARIGDASGKPSAKVQDYLTGRGAELWGQPLPPPQSSQGFCDYRSCDELPVIGPDFREPQLLVAGGFMGGGLGLGWYGGQQLAELIATGACPQLPRALWPTRLRSL